MALCCGLAIALLSSACTSPPPAAAPAPREQSGVAAVPPTAVPAAVLVTADAQALIRPLPGVASIPAPPASASASAAEPDRSAVPRNPRYVKLPPPAALRSFDALQQQVARRLVEAHPDTSFTHVAPPRLLAIPVIEIELNQDGSVRNTRVVRHPSTGSEATALALAAIRRAAPFGNVSAVPKPWKVVEAFLFDDQLRFKPRTLDLD